MTETAGKKERTSYNLNSVVVPELRDLLRRLNAEADCGIDDFMDAYDDGVIDEAEFRALLVRMAKLLTGTRSALNIANLLAESGPEAAARDIQSEQLLRKAVSK